MINLPANPRYVSALLCIIMVKGRIKPPTAVPVKRGPGKNTPSTSSSVSSPTVSAHKPGKFRSVPSCCECGIVVADDVKALQCDRCTSSEIWKCADCLHLSNDLYDQLVSDPKMSLKWLCNRCDQAVMEGQNSKLEQLITVIEKLMEKYDGVERSLATKCDSALSAKLETRIQAMEEKLSRIESNLDHRAQYRDTAVEDRLNSLESRLASTPVVGDNSTGNDNGVTDEVLIKCAVQEEVKRINDEDKELEARKNNVVIFRIPEKRTDDVQQRKESDVTFVKDLFDCVFDMKIVDDDVTHMYRLGRWEENKPRPLLISFRNIEQKDKIMSNLRNLKQPVEKFQGISICHDLHPKERQERKRLVESAKQEHADLGEDSAENYRFIVVGRGARQKVIKIKKRSINV